MAADITSIAKKSKTQGVMPLNVYVLKNAQSDWISFAGLKGVSPLFGMTITIAAAVGESFSYGSMVISGTYTAASTSISVITAQITRLPPYYVATAGGEIMEVTADSAPGAATSTLTVRRGVLGTTATVTGIANTNVVRIMNMVVLGSATLGPTFIRALPMVGDPTPSDTFSSA